MRDERSVIVLLNPHEGWLNLYVEQCAMNIKDIYDDNSVTITSPNGSRMHEIVLILKFKEQSRILSLRLFFENETYHTVLSCYNLSPIDAKMLKSYTNDSPGIHFFKKMNKICQSQSKKIHQCIRFF